MDSMERYTVRLREEDVKNINDLGKKRAHTFSQQLRECINVGISVLSSDSKDGMSVGELLKRAYSVTLTNKLLIQHKLYTSEKDKELISAIESHVIDELKQLFDSESAKA